MNNLHLVHCVQDDKAECPHAGYFCNKQAKNYQTANELQQSLVYKCINAVKIDKLQNMDFNNYNSSRKLFKQRQCKHDVKDIFF